MRFLCIFSLLLSLGLNSEENLYLMSFEELANVEVISSTRTEQKLRSVPSSMTVIERDEIEKLGVDSLMELMNYVPGFQTYRRAEESSHRSFSTRGRSLSSIGREVLILIDGLRTENPFLGGSASSLSYLSLKNVKRVEFLRGPASAVYGANALLGIVNVVTDKTLNEVHFQSFSNGAIDSSLQVSKEYQELMWNVYFRAIDDPGESYNLPDPLTDMVFSTDDSFKAYDSNASLSWRKSHLDFQYYERSNTGFYSFDSLGFGGRSYEVKSYLSSFKQDVEYTDSWEGFWRFLYRHQEDSNRIRSAPNTILDYSGLYRTFSVSNFNNLKLTEGLFFQLGVDYRRLEFSDANLVVNETMTSPVVSELVNQDIISLYSQWIYKISESLELTFGGRFDRVSAVDSNLSPRFALVYHLNDVHTVKLLYGEAFRSPSFVESFVISPVIDGNPGLEPELVETWEWVYLAHYERLHLQLSYFYSTLSNEVVQSVVSGKRTFVNDSGEESYSGLEAELRYFLTASWSVRAGGSHYFNSPSSSFRDSEYLAFAALNFEKPKYNLNLSANYASSQDRLSLGSSELVTLSGYWDLNAKFIYHYSKDLDFFVKGKNLLNDRYETPAQGELENGVPNRGLELSFGVKWQF